jgi:threonine synthase
MSIVAAYGARLMRPIAPDERVSSVIHLMHGEFDSVAHRRLGHASDVECRADRRVAIPPARLAALRAGFAAGRCSDEETIETIRRVHQRTGELLDPHGAVAVHVAGIARGRRDVPMVALACAHPAKFPDAVERATGVRPALPARLADLHQRTLAKWGQLTPVQESAALEPKELALLVEARKWRKRVYE